MTMRPHTFVALALAACIGCGPGRAELESQYSNAVEILEYEQKLLVGLQLESAQIETSTGNIQMISAAEELKKIATEKLREINAKIDKQTAKSRQIYRDRAEVKKQPLSDERQATLMDLESRYAKSNSLVGRMREESYQWVDALKGKAAEGSEAEAEMKKLLELQKKKLADERESKRKASGIDNRIAVAKEAVRKAQARVDDIRDQLQQLGG